jgi:hypothetical protein
MDKKLKDVNLINELRETFEDMEIQLYEDEKHWVDTWKERGIKYNNLSQEERFMNKMQEYFTDWKDLGVPFPWRKVIGEAHICLVREKKLTDRYKVVDESE